ncbi:hypothetical protein [Mucilaginibacter pedocola]|uniref:PKD domain-containing protein n=1 Tax=Mucilaginibacter pedocola TaxID=1792845 RepID=A0A1S9PH16_9SPHI|nr:hypothetical protein [Mucilaginibacter pedocola]OOQ60209.1 hypothetical protein BC343_25980 [Mucilaginibacter pedocola]
MQTEAFYISRWREKVETALGWGECSNWSDLDFEKLSAMFLERTGTMLSITTLKRIWGKVKYDSTPNAATLNALARFSGFDDWRAFKQDVDVQLAEPAVITSPPVAKKRKILPVAFALVAIFVVITAILAWIIKPEKTMRVASNAPVKFEARVVAEGLPNSVVFNYDASSLPGDSVTLQQTWDPRRTESIATIGTEHTSLYYYPGYFTAKLISGGKVMKETPVYIKTNGWQGIVEKEPAPVYLSKADISLPGAMGVSAKTFAGKTGSAVFTGRHVSFYNVKEFGIDGGDFTLEATLRNTSTPEEAACRNVMIYVLGKRNAIIIPLTNPGCISNQIMFTSSDWIRGKDHDLSAFGCDQNQFQHFSCSVKNMLLTVSLNGKQVFNTPITQTIKEVAGLCFRFEGTGQIKHVKLSNSSKTVLDDDFTKIP